MAHVDCTGTVSQTKIMYNAGFVEEGKVCDIVHSVELWRIHLGEGI